MARIRGVDRSPQRARAAAGRVGLDPEGRIAFKVAGRRSLPFPDAFFDLVAQVDGRPRPAEIARVLRPGGFLVLARTGPIRSSLLLGGRSPWPSLARHGIELLESAEAGDGSFSVGRRRGDESPARAD